MTPLQAQPFVEAGGAGLAFLAGRLLVGVVLAFMGVNHFANGEQMAGYAAAKGTPAAGLMVPLTGGLLLFAGLGIAAGAFTTLAAGALVVFFLGATPVMHDFWAVPEDQQQDEMTHFLKNAVLLGGSLVLLALSTGPWPYAANVGLL